MTDPGNYRPIALLPIVSKVLERIVHNKLSSFLSPWLRKKQSGFRKAGGTVPQLVRLTQQWSEGIDRSHYIGALFFDLKKSLRQSVAPWTHCKIKCCRNPGLGINQPTESAGLAGDKGKGGTLLHLAQNPQEPRQPTRETNCEFKPMPHGTNKRVCGPALKASRLCTTILHTGHKDFPFKLESLPPLPPGAILFAMDGRWPVHQHPA